MLKIIIFHLCVCLLSSFALAKPSFLDDQLATQAPPCKDGEFRCTDESCLPALSRCNGTIECDDGSDETFVLCRNDQCRVNQFRCAYGACVDGRTCDGTQHCADNSDELLTRCTIETNDINFPNTCDNGQELADEDKCDGKVDCTDGSDETIAKCTEVKCGKSFKCAYGACIHESAKCDGIRDCKDGSDESVELCNKKKAVSTTPMPYTTHRPINTTCVLPPIPENGKYEIVYDKVERDGVRVLALRYTCNDSYELVGQEFVICFGGAWSHEAPKCQRFCWLPIAVQSIHYHCLKSRNSSIAEATYCETKVPPGTIVKPVCKYPEFYYPGTLPLMVCEDGEWDNDPLCIADCGRITPKAIPLAAGGWDATRDELPWHVGVYNKLQRPYQQICGGTIISHKIIISAAHCFWNETKQPPENYAIAAGKLGREWNDPNDNYVQRRNVLDIKLPNRFRGAHTSFQDDIAILMVNKALRFNIHVRPVCLDFDTRLEKQQLLANNLGKVAGWGLTAERGEPSDFLKVVELPYIPVKKCLEDMPFSYKEFITADKICAGYYNGTGTAVCKGDSGGGLVFPHAEGDIQRYYLRGIVSTTQSSDEMNNCNTRTPGSFTHVTSHKHFITSHFNKYKEYGFQFVETKRFRNDDEKRWEW